MPILLFVLVFISGPQAKAYSLTGSCEKFLMGIRGPRVAQTASETPLYELGTFRGFFRPVFRHKSWKAVQFHSKNLPNRIELAAVSERLNGLDADLSNTREVSVYSFVKRGTAEINSYLDEVRMGDLSFTRAVNELWRSKMQRALQLGPAVPVTGALLPFSLAASHFPESIARMALSAVAVPVLATVVTAMARNSQRDRALAAHLNWVDRMVNDPNQTYDSPVAFYSQNVQIPVALLREMLRSEGGDEMMRTLAKEYMARNPVNVMTGMARGVISQRYAVDKPDVVTVCLDQMVFKDQGEWTDVTYIRVIKELPPEINGNDGGGGKRVIEFEQSSAMELQPVRIRVQPGDRR